MSNAVVPWMMTGTAAVTAWTSSVRSRLRKTFVPTGIRSQFLIWFPRMTVPLGKWYTVEASS